MKATIVYAILACVFTTALSDVVRFKDCGSKVGKINSVDISSCPKLPCELKRGTKVGVTINFSAAKDTAAVKSVVHGVIAGIPVPFPLPESDACKTLSPSCPLVNAGQYTYTNALEVQSMYPAISLVVRWELTDANNDDLICFEVPARVV